MRAVTWCYIIFCLLTVLLFGCKSYEDKKKELPDDANRGVLRVSADESFKPIIDEQVQVYEALHSGAKIQVTYKPEADCLKDIFNDSVKLIIATRGYNNYESSYVIDSFRLAPRQMVVARDAIAVIVNINSTATLMTMPELKQILKGKNSDGLFPVFDGLKATSTVRFIVDSILRGDSLAAAAVAAKTSEEVISYVARETKAIGLIGVSWIGNPEDPVQKSFLKTVKMVRLQDRRDSSRYVYPAQLNIYEARYPLFRDVYYLLNEKHNGLGTAFANFMSSERGQLIFRRGYLMPAQKNFIIRPVKVRE